MSGWAFLSGFANTLGNRLQADHELEQKQKLMQMQQDAEMKRQQFLDKYRSDLEMERDKAKDERQKDDVVGTFKDAETGSWFGRTRSGGSVPLHATSEEFQGDLATKRKLGNEKTEGQIDLNDARTTEVGARTNLMGKQGANIDSQIAARDSKPVFDKTVDGIKKSYLSLMDKEKTRELQAAAAAQKEGKAYTPRDTLQLQQGVIDQLQYAYGADAVNSALGKSQHAESPKSSGEGAPPKTNSLGYVDGAPIKLKPGAPYTAQQAMADATAAQAKHPEKAAEIEARLKQYLQEYAIQ